MNKLGIWAIVVAGAFFVGVLSANPVVEAVGGEILSVDSSSLILASAQSFSWMIPVVLSVIGIGLLVVSRKSENS